MEVDEGATGVDPASRAVAPEVTPVLAPVADPIRTSGPSIAVAAACAVWVAADALRLLGPLTNSSFVLLTVVALSSTVIAVRRNQPRAKLPWLLIATGFCFFLAGGIAREALDTLGNLTAHRSLLPDLLTIPGYIFAGCGLLGIAFARRDGIAKSIDLILDATVAALAAMTVGWLFLINPAVFSHHVPLTVRLVLSLYTPLSTFLVAITASLAFSAGRQRVVSSRLLLAGMAFFLCGDVVYMLLETGALPLTAHLVDIPYALAYICFIACVLHPSMVHQTDIVPASESAPTIGRLAIIAVALAVPAFVTITQVDAPGEDRVALAIIVMSLTTAAALLT
ncbi:MAG: hypothetical protein ABJC79_06945, partial [Acidimicrobiia bacterium]